ncbi:MAG: SIS domain-containing protein [Anaerolineaceae bacterium]|nr:SIS domain-containing protein [Anaerolineaceae bacterium]
MDAGDYPRPERYEQVIFTGCGSTYYLSRWAARMCEELTGVICRAAPSSDLFLHPNGWLGRDRKTLLVASSRSAATTETIRAIKLFTENNAGDVVVVTCNPDQPMGSQSKHVISATLARELSVAQTRSFSTMMLANAWLIEGGAPQNTEARLRSCGERQLNQYKGRISELATDKALQRFFFLGSGAQYGLANEIMLKMKEMSLSYSESFHFMEFRHGPMAMVDSNSLVVGLLGDAGMDHEMAVLKDMKSKGARTLAIADSVPSNSNGAVDDLIVMQSELSPLWRSVLYLPVLQWLACERAVSNGLDPDRPANLDAVVVLDDSPI